MECPYCGKELEEDNFYTHIWRNHKDKDIERVIIELDSFIRNISTGFKKRYGLSVEVDEIMQYLRTNIFLVLKDKYNPALGRPTYFAKATCKIFLKRFIQEYYYKKNSLYKTYSTKNLLNNPDDRRHISFDSSEGYVSEFIIIDYPSTSPLDFMMVEDIKALIINELTPLEKSIFKYLVDYRVKHTQQEIAHKLNISQSSVSGKIKIIREKTLKVFNDIDYPLDFFNI